MPNKNKCNNCRVKTSECKALQPGETDKITAERRMMQCADDCDPIDLLVPIFD